MDLKLFGIGILLVTAGILLILFITRIMKWWAGLVFKYKLTYTAIKHPELTKEDVLRKRTETWPARTYWLVWLFITRLLGIFLALSGIFMIIQYALDK
jgi:hypothetical protein